MKKRYVHQAHISEAKFRQVLKLFCADIPALTVAGLVGRSVQTTQRLYDRVRLRILEMAVDEARPLAGEVEIGESCFGARRLSASTRTGAPKATGIAARPGSSSWWSAALLFPRAQCRRCRAPPRPPCGLRFAQAISLRSVPGLFQKRSDVGLEQLD